jgi:hypothetical protein
MLGNPRLAQCILRSHMDFLAEYASFLAKTVTLVVAILVV